MVSLQLDASVPARGVQLALSVPRGRTVALLGPNGSGKSTVLGLAAGLVAPDEGVVMLDGRTVARAVDGGLREWVPAHRRRVALLAQDPMLFPHLDVLDNVAFGPRSGGRSRREARDRARHWLAAVDALDLAGRAVGALSGGQGQRVALARALAAEPDLLLLDEPLAALDVDAAAAMRHVLGQVLGERTTLLVTHDPLDVALLSQEAVVLEAGRVVESGPVRRIARTPRSTFAASLFGLNLLTGTASGPDAVRTMEGAIVTGLAEPELVIGEPAVAVFAPVAVSVHRERPSGSPRNVFTGTIDVLEPHGHLVRVRVGELRADITAASVADLGLVQGASVHLAVKAAEVTLYLT